MTTKEKGYQGWTNHATWCVALWIGNTEPWYRHCEVHLTAQAIEDAPESRQVREGIWSERDAARYGLADALKEWTEEALFEDGDTQNDDARGFRGDMLRGYFEDVNFQEIADNYLDDADGFKALKARCRKRVNLTA